MRLSHQMSVGCSHWKTVSFIRYKPKRNATSTYYVVFVNLPNILNTFKVRISFCFNVCGLKHLTNNLTIMFCVSLQKLRDIFALVVRRMHMSFCGTPLTPCRKPVSMDTPSESSSAFLFECRKAFVYFVWISYLFLHICRLDRQTQATTLVHQIFGGYLRSRGIDVFFFPATDL